MGKLKLFMMILLAGLTFYSCQKEVSSGTSNLTGFAYLYNSNGIRVSDNSGISVSIKGTTISTTTGADGKWCLTNLRTGTYSFTFSKTGYNTVQSTGFQFSGNGQLFGSTSLFPPPTYNIINLSDSTFQGGLKITGTFTGILPSQYCYHLYFGFNSNVSSNYLNYFISEIEMGDIKQNTFNTTLYNGNYLYSYQNYLVGDTIYMVAYTDNNPEIAYYNYSYESYYYVYPCLSPIPSNVVQIIVR